ncbi:hypothetical protein J2Z42_001483 [Clostridium algifaecis]|uniref:Uncharacterized protein n=1 Tax=Clostridium algifaecis TaxID=1472040 RepID=A0ABS4KRZ1_9CLOT|nr:hypothetical protein [Clostridium algifaecis]MBP2032809.1 hypothetical protein [Clostridium algifaecis]
MINSISNNHIMQNIATNTTVSSKAAEEANESPSEKIAEANKQNTQSSSMHIINSYA